MTILLNALKLLPIGNYCQGRYSILISLVFLFLPVSTLAGPPFRTDDPEPVEYHHWEFYLASQITSSNDGLSGTAPHAEINFGVLHNTQIHMIVPLSFNHPRVGTAAYGPGDIEIGLKYRFVNETALIPQIGMFPLVEIPTGNASKSLGAGHAQILVPLWGQKSWGSWTTYGGGGYLVNIPSDPANSWFVGWEVQHDLSKFVTAGGELYGNFYPSEGSGKEAAFNIGAIINFSDNHHLLLSAGRDILGQNDVLIYMAYQLTIGPASK